MRIYHKVCNLFLRSIILTFEVFILSVFVNLLVRELMNLSNSSFSLKKLSLKYSTNFKFIKTFLIFKIIYII